jgi:hypothetical protein
VIKMLKRRHADYRGSPAVARCRCGCTIELAEIANPCEGCGLAYDRNARRVFDRRFWGEGVELPDDFSRIE